MLLFAHYFKRTHHFFQVFLCFVLFSLIFFCGVFSNQRPLILTTPLSLLLPLFFGFSSLRFSVVFEIGRGIFSSGEISRGKLANIQVILGKAVVDETGNSCPVSIYLFKVSNRNTWKGCEICSQYSSQIS